MISGLKEKTFDNFQRVKWQGTYVRYALFTSVREIQEEIEILSDGRSVTSASFWSLMETSGMQGVECRYGLLYTENGQALAVFYYQIKDFSAKESINWSSDLKWTGQLRQGIQKSVASLIRFKTLISGNLCMTGPYGYIMDAHFDHGAGAIFAEAAQWTRDILAEEGVKIQAVLIKDFYQKQKISAAQAYAEFQIQPAMKLALRSGWHRFEDYLADLKSKYRVRYRKARERAEGISKIRLSNGELQKNQLDQMYALYKKRADAADFNIATLEPDYFHRLHEIMGASAETILYYEGDQMLAFMCCLKDGQHIDAQFTGYVEEKNSERDLYLNLLYDVIALGIEERASVIHYARTAMEIKNSIGAEPHDLYCYLSYASGITQKMIPNLVTYLQPAVEWNQRHPFKAEGASS